MQSGHQSTGLSFWEHGEMVAARYRDLMNPNPSMTWRLPAWFTTHADFIRESLSELFAEIQTYQLWHDCGKPYCRELDSDGKVHYPNHAAISADIWRSLSESTVNSSLISDLIEQDMLCHQLKPAEAMSFASKPHVLILLVTALCELHANASMFGGISSDSFKIKFKRLDKCGTLILKELT